MSLTTADCIANARANGLVVPAFNIPYLSMMRPVVQALIDINVFGFIEVACCEWERFGCRSQKAVFEEYSKWCNTIWMRLHQDHVPVINEEITQLEPILFAGSSPTNKAGREGAICAAAGPAGTYRRA